MNNHCPSCQSVYNITPQHVGRTFACKKCGTELSVAPTGLVENRGPQDFAAEEAEAAPQRRRARGDSNLSDYLTFRRMIVPFIIQIVFWIGVIGCFVAGVGSIFFGLVNHGGIQAVLGGLLILVLGPLMVRIYCELIMVAFRMNDTLTDIKKLLERR